MYVYQIPLFLANAGLVFPYLTIMFNLSIKTPRLDGFGFLCLFC